MTKRSKSREAVSRVVGYIRVSTQEQGRSGLGLEAQREQIERACAYKGWELVAVYCDVGTGATLDGRQELNKALWLLGREVANRADGLVVAKLDRLSRSVLDFAELLRRARLEDWALIALDMDIDTSTPTGKLIAGVMMNVAEWERERIGERISDALQAKKRRGESVGAAPQTDEEDEAEICELRKKGLSYTDIELATGWGQAVIARVIKKYDLGWDWQKAI